MKVPLTEEQRAQVERLRSGAEELGLTASVRELNALLAPARFAGTRSLTGVRYVPVQSESNPTESYVVTITEAGEPLACTCPSWHYHRDRMACKHMKVYHGYYTKWAPGDAPISLLSL